MLIQVSAAEGALKHHGRLTFAGKSMRCALGRSGLVSGKTEGDGGTPLGRFPIRRLFYRPDRLNPPQTFLPKSPLKPGLGWCDDPNSPAYNRLVRLPCPWGHETMWRKDGLYDLVVVLGHNDSPPDPGRGSAIFLHVTGDGHAATEGCVALAREDLLVLLAQARAGDEIEIVR